MPRSRASPTPPFLAASALSVRPRSASSSTWTRRTMCARSWSAARSRTRPERLSPSPQRSSASSPPSPSSASAPARLPRLPPSRRPAPRPPSTASFGPSAPASRRRLAAVPSPSAAPRASPPRRKSKHFSDGKMMRHVSRRAGRGWGRHKGRCRRRRGREVERGALADLVPTTQDGDGRRRWCLLVLLLLLCDASSSQRGVRASCVCCLSVPPFVCVVSRV
mmetsp:Transcript_16946/g.49377  ORF Transcript_16946/g.49377 Transcript_16946/m.49377 type:complete len:221 (+) Transcript_16946:423-1085(+)